MRFRNMEMFRLEDRVLFEAAAAAEIVEAAEAASDNPNANVNEGEKQAQEDRDALKNAPPENPAEQAAQNSGKAQDDPAELGDVDAQVEKLIQGELPVTDASAGMDNGLENSGDGMTDAILVTDSAAFSTGRELVVINGTVPDLDTVLSGLKPNQEALVLDDGSGLDQLNGYLDAHEGKYEAIHFVTHGSGGMLSINGQVFKAGQIDSASWSAVGEHLTESGDILLYGCDTAATDDGRALVSQIAEASGADVAASDDATGISGDWDLEYTVGALETETLSVTDYRHDLAVVTITVDTLLDDDDTATTSLRDALTTASDNGGEYLIEFDVSGTIELDPGLGALSISNRSGNALSVTIDGGDEIVIDGNAQTSILDVVDLYGSSDITLNLRDITLTGGMNDLGTGGAIRYSGVRDIVFTCTLDGVTISDSTAVYGGGIGLYGNNVNLTLLNSTIYGNTAAGDPSGGSDGGDGGGIYVKSDNLVMNVINSTLTGNVSKDGTYGGGGIFLSLQDPSATAPRINVLNSILYGNYAGTDASDLYISDAASLDCNVVYSVYGTIVNTQQLVPLTNTEGSVKLETTSENLSSIFESVTEKDGLTVAEITDNHHVLLNNQGAAAWAGTQIASVGTGFRYLADDGWKYSNGTDTVTPDASAILTVDQNGESRTTVLDQLGVAEFAIGAAVPSTIYLKIVPEDTTSVYNGQAQTLDTFQYYTASGAEVTSPSAVISADAAFSDSADVGTYELAALSASVTSGGNDVSGMYDFDFGSGTLVITAKEIIVSGITADDKVYDGTTDATLNFDTVVIDGMITGDDLGVDATGAFADKNVGVNKVVTISDLALTGTDAGNYIVAQSGNQTETTASITAREITVTSGITADDKVYDGTTDATLNFDTVVIDGMITGDDLGVDATGTFADKNAGVDKLVTISDLVLTGDDAGNYIVAQSGNQTETTASITAREITVTSGITADDKVYDGTTAATLNFDSVVIDGMITGDDLGVDAAGAFADKNVGVDKLVTISDLVLTGDDAGNYILVQSGSQTETTADITPAEITVSGGVTADNKVYDGTTDATLNFDTVVIDGMITGDDLGIDATGTFADKNVGVNKVVTISDLVLTGDDAGNYIVAQSGNQTETTASITAKEITVTSGITADDKVYDGTTAATLNFDSVVIDGMITGDDLGVDATGTFADKNVGIDKVVTISDLVLTGDDAGNYIVAQSGNQTETTASITAREITVTSGITADDKVYDGTTAATLNFDSVVIDGMIAGDNLVVNGTGAFTDKNAGVDKVVLLTGLTLTGADAGNYVLSLNSQQSTAADITPRNVVLTAGSASKYFDGTPLTNDSYTISGDGFVSGEGLETVVVTGSQTAPGSSENIIESYVLASGTDAGNYSITLQAGTLTVMAYQPGWTSQDQYPSIMNWNYTMVAPAVLGNALASGGIDVFSAGNLYTAEYSTLIAAREANQTFRPAFGGMELLFRDESVAGLDDLFFSSSWQPGKTGFSLDLPVDDVGDSIIGSRGNVIFKESLGSGYELFPDSFSFTLNAGDAPSEWLLPPPELRLPAALFDETPADAFAGLGMQIEQAPKLSMFKSDLELLLDEMSGV